MQLATCIATVTAVTSLLVRMLLQTAQRTSPTFVPIFLSTTLLTSCIVKTQQHCIDHLEVDLVTKHLNAQSPMVNIMIEIIRCSNFTQVNHMSHLMLI